MRDAVKNGESRLALVHSVYNYVWEAMWLLVKFYVVDSLRNLKERCNWESG